MNRRNFLKLTAAIPLLMKSTLAVPSLKMIDAGDYTEQFAPTMESLRKMQAMSVGQSDSAVLKGGRAWAGGSSEFVPRLSPLGRWDEIPRDGGVIPLRILAPAEGPIRGVILSIHGGGWAMGCATSEESKHAELVKSLNVAVVSPDYRLAPENPFPAGPHDCLAAAVWLADHSKNVFGTSKLAIWGSSAGGHLAASTLLGLRPEHRRKFRCAVLYYGVYDLSQTEKWSRMKDSDYPDLSPSSMTKFVDWFVPGTTDKDRVSGEYSPLKADLPSLPPALFMVGSADLLAPQSLDFAKKWANRNSVELVTYRGAPHGFNGYDVKFDLEPLTYSVNYLSRFL